MAGDLIREIRERFSVLEVAEELGMEVDARGKTWAFARSEDVPSVQLYEDHWWDYGAAQGGDVIDLVRQWYGEGDPEMVPMWKAVKWFEEGYAEDWETREPVKRTEPEPERDLTSEFMSALDLTRYSVDIRTIREKNQVIADRWVAIPHADTIERFRLGEDAFGNLLMPHYSHGRVHGVKVRHQDGAKSSFPDSQFNHLYRRYGLPEGGRHAIVCEGESDTWWMDKAFQPHGFVDVYGLPSGAQHYRSEWRQVLEAYQGVWLCFDNDKAGETARIEWMRRLNWRAQYLPVPIGFKDAREALGAGWVPKLED